MPPATRKNHHSAQEGGRNHSPTNKRTKHNVNLRLRVDRDLVRTRDGRSTVRAVRVRVVRAEIDVRARDALDTLDVGVDDRVAEEVEVEVVLCAFPSVRLSKPLRCSKRIRAPHRSLESAR